MSTGLKLGSISITESDFLAQDTIVTISPTFRHPTLHFISGDFGPFEPYIPTSVPLWLAVTLKKKEKCSIELPEWLSVEYLEERLENERTNVDFESLPYHYMEIASTLMSCCQNEIPERDKLLAVLQDLENIRADRLRTGMLSVAESIRGGKFVHSVKLNNISSIEIFSIKRIFLDSLGMFANMFSNEQAGGDIGLNGTSASAGGRDSTGAGGRRLRRHR